MHKRSRGFSLIEIMTVVVIIGVLAAVAFPSYTNHVRKTTRTEAKTRLLQIAQLEERNFTEKNSYTTNIAGLLGVAGTVYSSPNNATNSGYQITAAAGTGAGQTIANSFVLTAVPQGSQTADTECGNLKLLHTGKREITGTGTTAKCWN